MIPARIIQTWKTRTLPRRYRRFQDEIRRLNPEFEMLVFDDAEMAEFVHRRYPDYGPTFDALSTISKVDLFRLLAVHALGGFYLDLDIALIRSIEPLRLYTCVFPFETVADPHFIRRYGAVELIGQYAFGAVQGHPFLAACAENIRRVVADPSLLDPPSNQLLALSHGEERRVIETLYRTGPHMATRTWVERPDLRDGIRILYAQNRQHEIMWSCFGIYGFHMMDGDAGWKRHRPPTLMQRIRHGRWRASQVATLRTSVELPPAVHSG